MALHGVAAPTVISTNANAQFVGSEPNARMDVLEKDAFRLRDTSEPVVFPRVADRLYPVGKFTWVKSAGITAPVYAGSFPDVWLSIPRVLSAAQGFKFFRCDKFHLEIAVSGQPMLYGSIIAAILPYGYDSSIDAYSDLRSMSMFPHVIITNGTPGNVTLEVPWQYPYQYYDIDGFYNDSTVAGQFPFGTLSIRVFNPLTAQTVDPGSDAQISIFCKAINPEFYGWNGKHYVAPTMWGESAPPPPNKEGAAMASASDQASTPNLFTDAVKVVSKPLGGAIDTITGAVENVASKLGPIGDVVGSALGFLGLEKPNDPSSSDRMTLNFAPGATNADTLFQGTSLSFCQNARLDSSAAVAGFQDQTMLISAIAGTPAFLGTWEFKAASLPFIIPTHPSWVPDPIGDYRKTFCGLAVAPFVFYRTSMNYLFQVVSGPFQAGMLRVCWVAGDPKDYNEDTNIDDTMTQYIRLNGDARLKISTPFISDKPFLHACGDSTFTLPRSVIDETGCGYLHVSWINPVVNPDPTVDGPVYINVFVSAAEDFVGYRYVGGIQAKAAPAVMEGEMDVRSEFTQKFPPIHPSFKSVTTSGLFMGGDSVTTLKDVLLPMQRLGTGPIALSSWKVKFEPNATRSSYKIMASTGNVASSNNPLDYYASFFAFWRGGARVMALTGGTDTPSTVPYLTVTYDNGYNNDPHGEWFGQTPREFSSPHYNPCTMSQLGFMSSQLFSSTRKTAPQGDSTDLCYTLSAPTTMVCDLYSAVSDDFQLMGLVPGPVFSSS